MKKLIALVLVLLVAVSFAQPGPGRSARRGMQWGKMLCKKLDLSKDQVSKIEALKTKHQKVMIDMKADLQKLKIEKREIVKSDNIDRKAFIDIEERIMKQQDKMRLEGANHRMDVYSLLTPEQKVKFGELRDKFAHKRFGKAFRNGRGMGPGFRGQGGFQGQGNPECPMK